MVRFYDDLTVSITKTIMIFKKTTDVIEFYDDLTSYMKPESMPNTITRLIRGKRKAPTMLDFMMI